MPSPAATALDTTDEHSTTALYRAAIGAVNPDYYLPLFTRFEAAGRGGLSWNWAAALYTLNWLAFRRLWHAALVYGGLVVLLALGVLGIGRLVYQFSEETQWALMGGLFVLAVVLPGFGGNAVLFATTRQRVEAALNATQSVAEACILLERRTPSRRALILQMVANALALGLAAYSWSQFTGLAPLPNALPKAESGRADARNVAVGRATEAAEAASAPAAIAAATAPIATASASAPAASAPVAAASAAQPAASAALPAASSAWTPPTAELPAPVRAAASAPAAARAASAPAKTPAASASATPAAPRTAPQAIARRVSSPLLVEAQPSAVPQGNAPRTVRFSVNVGAFTDENAALNVYVRLTDARLPATRQTFVDSKGPRVVVRVGPYDTATEAEAAADTIRALGLGVRSPAARTPG